MNCPYCRRNIPGWTGLQELQRFQRHLARCRKNPNNIVIDDGEETAVTPIREQDLLAALKIREESGQ